MKYFITSWDKTGVECIKDITEYSPDVWDKEQLIKVLKGNDPATNPIGQIITSLTLRARFNGQRCYEIYVYTATDGMTEDDIRDWADSSPQEYADWVRENNKLRIVDDRKIAPKQVIN